MIYKLWYGPVTHKQAYLSVVKHAREVLSHQLCLYIAYQSMRFPFFNLKKIAYNYYIR